MRDIVVMIPAGQIEADDEILVPLTVPPTRVKVWKTSEAASSDRIGIHCMQGEDTWRVVLQKTDLVQVIR